MKKLIGSIELNRIYQMDCREGMKHLLKENSVDLIIADPPYNIGLKGTKVNLKKGYKTIDEEWDYINNFEQFTKEWIKECLRVLKPGGSILVYGTHHNIFIAGYMLEVLGFDIKSQYTWKKKNPPPGLLGTNPTFSTEFIIWATKKGVAKYNLNYAKAINHGKNIHNFFETPLTPRKEKKHGIFSAQKCLEVTIKLVNLHSNPKDIILVPFGGSGTECLAASLTKREFIAFEKCPNNLELANNRLEDIEYYSNYLQYLNSRSKVIV